MPITALKYSSILQVPASKLLGNTTGAAAAAAGIGLGTGLSFSAGNLTLSGIANASLANSSVTINTAGGLSGGGSVSLGSSLSLTIADGALSNAKLANSSLTVTAGSGLSGGGAVSLGSSVSMSLATSSAYSILGNATSGSAVPSALSSGIILGTPGYTPSGANILQATASAASYLQMEVRNSNSGAGVSSDFIATADNGNDTTHYADYGINGSGGGAAPFTTANAAYLYSVDNELDLGALGASGQVKFYTTGGTSPVLAGYFDATQKLNLTNALEVTQGGTGVASTTAYAVLCGGTTSTGALQAVSGLGTAGYVLTSNGAGALPTWQAAAGGGTAGNPTASVGLTAVNGSASTYLRSDGAPALSQAIAPTWTAKHIFAQTTGTTTNCLQTTGIASQSVASIKSVLGSSQTGAHLETYNSDGTTLTAALSSAGKLTTYNGLTTAGFGVPTIVASGRATAQTAAVSSVTTFTPSADGTFLINWNVNITTLGSGNFQCQCTYTDEAGSAQTISLLKINSSGTTSANNAGAGVHLGIGISIRAKASNAITIKTSSGGTYTGCTFNVEGTITQLT